MSAKPTPITVNNSLVTPSKILCIGRNYVAHIKELGNETPKNMVLFNKNSACISNTLYNQHNNESLHYEAELCFFYGNGKFNAVGLGIDLTKRTLQNQLKSKGLPWERAKSFTGAAVFSNFIAIEKISLELHFTLHINKVLVQSGSIALMMYKPDTILKELEAITTLYDGDIVMTGTPKGVGEIQQNDTFTMTLFDGKKELLSQSWLAHHP